MAINPGDLATVVESGADGTIIRSGGSDGGTFYDARLTGTGGRFPAGDAVRCVEAEIDAGYSDGHCGHEGCCGPLPWWRGRPGAKRPKRRRHRRNTQHFGRPVGEAPKEVDSLPAPKTRGRAASSARTPCATEGFSGRLPEMNQTEVPDK